MSFAVIQTGGKQYKVKAGEIIKIEKLENSKPETKVEFKEILAYGDEKNIELGLPTISGAKVEADLLKNSKNRTILIFKKRRRKNSRRKNGHRQQFSLIRINKIFSKDGKVISEAEKIKKDIGTAIPTNSNRYPVKGRDMRSGTPKEVNISEEDTSEALNPIIREIINGIKDALENTPPELSADLVDMGLTLTGGGSLLKNIDKRFAKETGLPVHIADDPLACVAVGTAKALDQEETFSTVLLSEY